MASSGNDNSRTVCVMDASGHLGSALVHLLLLRGYTVHAALQPHAHGGEFQSAEELLPCNNEKLRIFDADPFDYHSITNALKGCCGLFYCFQPPSDHSTYDEFMAEIEVRAAHNVLEACAQTDTMEKFKLWHALSKTLAEKSAWALAMDRGINMVTINGGLLMTPDLDITNPYLKGAAEMYEDGVFVTVDLRFIANAHICVFEDVSSYGRYLCFNHVINCSHDADKLAQMLLPSSDSSPPQSWEKTRIYQQRISNRKLNNLMEFENDQLLGN
ncbi:hypothetical protein V6N13_063724 [Hibiscus sabdariffa]